MVLVWTRKTGQPWRRNANVRSGSHATGSIKKFSKPSAMERLARRAVFNQGEGAIKAWTNQLPGLRLVIEELELGLPR